MNMLQIQIEWHPEYVRAVCLNRVICWIARRGRGDGTLSAMMAAEISTFMGSDEFFELVARR